MDDRRLPVTDRELINGAELQRQRLQIVEAGDDVRGATFKVVFDVLGLARFQVLFIERAFLVRVIEADRSLAFVRAFLAVLENRERAERPGIEARFEAVVHRKDDVDGSGGFGGRADFAFVPGDFHSHGCDPGGNQMPLRRINVAPAIGERIVGTWRLDLHGSRSDRCCGRPLLRCQGRDQDNQAERRKRQQAAGEIPFRIRASLQRCHTPPVIDGPFRG